MKNCIKVFIVLELIMICLSLSLIKDDHYMGYVGPYMSFFAAFGFILGMNERKIKKWLRK